MECPCIKKRENKHIHEQALRVVLSAVKQCYSENVLLIQQSYTAFKLQTSLSNLQKSTLQLSKRNLVIFTTVFVRHA